MLLLGFKISIKKYQCLGLSWSYYTTTFKRLRKRVLLNRLLYKWLKLNRHRIFLNVSLITAKESEISKRKSTAAVILTVNTKEDTVPKKEEKIQRISSVVWSRVDEESCLFMS